MKPNSALRTLGLALSLLFASVATLFGQGAESANRSDRPEKPKELFTSQTLRALQWREIGPAVQGGRVVDFAVDLKDKRTIYAAVATGGLWKTTNAGTTWKAVYSNEKTASLGDVALDPSDSNIVWLGTGEANNQRSSSWGDGLYRSVSGGKKWQHVGLEKTGHIGRILVHPKDGKTVYVAALGWLWGPSEERGVYKTIDAGKTWQKALHISENTGVADIVMDPRDPDVLYAAAYQRRRSDYNFIGGGPESGIYKSSDGGQSWSKLTEGMPRDDMGRIGLAISASNPDTLYAIVEARTRGGIYRSVDRGASWEFRNGYNSIPWYFSQIRVDPRDADRLYVLGVPLSVSEDGGRTLRHDVARGPHVDHHALWIDPDDSDHLILGNDGGIYISYDRGQGWDFISNLPIGQFYAVAVDNRLPFYHVYGGTQDNQTLGGPSRTTDASGITNDDWYVVTGGDGFHVQVDPKDPNTVYGESQYGVLVRFDTATGERLGIQPKPPTGQQPYRWNWSAPLLISPHNHTTLYFAANKLFKSSDRGSHWEIISPDLTRQIDREKLQVMGKVWDKKKAVAYNEGIARYGNISALDESRLDSGLLYVGTDDGLIQVSRDGGKNWTRLETFSGVPDRTYVTRVVASRHKPATVYATFNNHRNVDFKPYILKSTDYGKTWTSISANLPETGPVHVVREHHRNPDLLFAGTELGAFASIDGGQKWIKLDSGLPTVPVHDIALQERENDLVIGTHGRGFWVLDDITPLEKLSMAALQSPQQLFPVRDTLLFNPTGRLGFGPGGAQGDRYFMARNPEFGAVITFYLKDSLEAPKKDEAKPASPPLSDSEEDQVKPKAVLAIYGEGGQPVRRLVAPTAAGMHRVVWDLARPPSVVASPPQAGAQGVPDQPGPRRGGGRSGPRVLPGKYEVRLELDGKVTDTKPFQVTTQGLRAMSLPDRQKLVEFLQEVSTLEGSLNGALQTSTRLQQDLALIEAALGAHAAAADTLSARTRELTLKNRKILDALRGKEKPEETDPPSTSARLGGVSGDLRLAGSLPTQTHRQEIDAVAQVLREQLPRLRELVERDLPDLNLKLDEAGVVWTPGRLPKIQ